MDEKATQVNFIPYAMSWDTCFASICIMTEARNAVYQYNRGSLKLRPSLGLYARDVELKIHRRHICQHMRRTVLSLSVVQK